MYVAYFIYIFLSSRNFIFLLNPNYFLNTNIFANLQLVLLFIIFKFVIHKGKHAFVDSNKYLKYKIKKKQEKKSLLKTRK